MLASYVLDEYPAYQIWLERSLYNSRQMGSACGSVWDEIHPLTHRRRAFSAQYCIILLVEFSTRMCHDPRDRIYALNRILGLEPFDDLRPNYNIAAAEVFERMTKKCLTQHGPQHKNTVPSLAVVLALAGLKSDVDNDNSLPSWVIDFHHLTNRSRAKALDYRACRMAQFKQDNLAFACIAPPTPANHITVRAYCFGTVVDVNDTPSCPRAYPEADSQSCHEPCSCFAHMMSTNKQASSHQQSLVLALIEWYCRCRSYAKSGMDSNNFEREFNRLLCCNDPDFSYYTRKLFSLDSFVKCATLLDSESAFHSIADLDNEVMFDALQPFLEYQSHPCFDRDRNLCRIRFRKRDYVAWVPKKTVPGDEICIFNGAPYPFVVREAEPGIYKLLGDAYIQGIIEDEVMAAKPADAQWLTLC